MKFKLIYLIGFSLFSISGCVIRDTQHIDNYGLESVDLEGENAILKIENYIDFDSLISDINKEFLVDNIPVLSLSESSNLHLVRLSPSTIERDHRRFIHRYNVLTIIDDLIFGDYPLDSLEHIYEEFYLNPHKILHYSETPDEAVVSIGYDEIEMDSLKDILLRILKKFELIKKSDSFKLILEKPITPPPSVPPAILEI